MLDSTKKGKEVKGGGKSMRPPANVIRVPGKRRIRGKGGYRHVLASKGPIVKVKFERGGTAGVHWNTFIEGFTIGSKREIGEN